MVFVSCGSCEHLYDEDEGLKRHDGPCGLPCVGGGIKIKDLQTGAHRPAFCPRCNPRGKVGKA